MVNRLPGTEVESNYNKIKEIAKLFFKLGVIAFGGPAVHIALMEEEVVRKSAGTGIGHEANFRV